MHKNPLSVLLPLVKSNNKTRQKTCQRAPCDIVPRLMQQHLQNEKHPMGVLFVLKRVDKNDATYFVYSILYSTNFIVLLSAL